MIPNLSIEEKRRNFLDFFEHQMDSADTSGIASVLTDSNQTKNLRLLISKKEVLTKDFERMETDINDWKKSHDKPRIKFKGYSAEETEKISKKAKIVEVASKVCLVIGAIFLFLGVMPLAIGFSILEGNPSPVLAGKIILPVLVSLLIGSTIGISLLFISQVLKNSEVIRKNRAVFDNNFKEFVNTHIVQDKNYIIDENMILNKKLHEIYLIYKRSIEALPQR